MRKHILAVGCKVVTPPTKGVLSGTAPNLTYTPNKDYNGPDTFTFKVNGIALTLSRKRRSREAEPKY